MFALPNSARNVTMSLSRMYTTTAQMNELRNMKSMEHHTKTSSTKMLCSSPKSIVLCHSKLGSKNSSDESGLSCSPQH